MIYLKEKMIGYETEYDDYSKTCKLTVYPLFYVKVGKTWSLGYFSWLKLEGEITGSETRTLSIIETNIIPGIEIIKLSEEQFKLHIFGMPVASFTYDYIHPVILSILMEDIVCEGKYMNIKVMTIKVKKLICTINNEVSRKGKVKKCNIKVIKSEFNINKDYGNNTYINILPK